MKSFSRKWVKKARFLNMDEFLFQKLKEKNRELAETNITSRDTPLLNIVTTSFPSTNYAPEITPKRNALGTLPSKDTGLLLPFKAWEVARSLVMPRGKNNMHGVLNVTANLRATSDNMEAEHVLNCSETSLIWGPT